VGVGVVGVGVGVGVRGKKINIMYKKRIVVNNKRE